MVRAAFLVIALALSASFAKAATVTVTLTDNGVARLYNCAEFSCLDTGASDGTDTTPLLTSYLLSASFTFDEADLVLGYNSQPFIEGIDSGTRTLAYSGDTTVELTFEGRSFGGTGPVNFSLWEIWPAYIMRTYMTGSVFWQIPSAIGTINLSHYGERSISYNGNPPAYTGAPELDLAFSPFPVSSYFVSGDDFAVTLFPGRFSIRIDVNNPAPVPLPAGGALLAGALAVLALWRRRTTD